MEQREVLSFHLYINHWDNSIFLFASCNIIHADRYILLSALPELYLLLLCYKDLDLINIQIAMATLTTWLCLRLWREHFHSSPRSDMWKPRLMFPFNFRRLFPHYRLHLQAAKHLLPKALCFPSRNKAGVQRGAGIVCIHHRLKRSEMFWQEHTGNRKENALWGQSPEIEQEWVLPLLTKTVF